jgi:hypothetical protein
MIAVASFEGSPLIWAEDTPQRRIVGLSFVPRLLSDRNQMVSDFPSRVGFPVFIYNAIRWLAGTPQGEMDPDASGFVRRVASSAPIVVEGPDKRSVRLESNGHEAAFAPAKAGFYTVKSVDGAKLAEFASSVADLRETAVSPLPQAIPPGTRPASDHFYDADVYVLLALLAVGLLLIEWFSFHRRLTI